MKIKLLTFGIAREMVGISPTEMELPEGADTETLQEILAEKYPALTSILSYAIAVNKSYVSGNQRLNENDEVAIIPPVSGG
jgi:molybdopterin synthase sulfur carrier subunit